MSFVLIATVVLALLNHFLGLGGGFLDAVAGFIAALEGLETLNAAGALNALIVVVVVALLVVDQALRSATKLVVDFVRWLLEAFSLVEGDAPGLDLGSGFRPYFVVVPVVTLLVSRAAVRVEDFFFP